MSELSSAAISAKDAITMPETIQHYFDTLNAKAFEQTAELFTQAGQLCPPFDKPIAGREAIARYLIKEASDMTFSPSQCAPAKSEAGKAFMVSGKVKNSLFAVNVSWLFVLNASAEIELVQVKLLAKLEELLRLNQSA